MQVDNFIKKGNLYRHYDSIDKNSIVSIVIALESEGKISWKDNSEFDFYPDYIAILKNDKVEYAYKEDLEEIINV